MKYNVGDKVRIVKERKGHNWNTWMNEYCWTTMTIEKVNWYYYEMKEDYGDWCWFEDMIEWLANEEEWTPKEWDVVLVKNTWTIDWKERYYIMKSKSWKYLCWQSINDYWSVESRGSFYYDNLKKVEEKKTERKLIMTDSEWKKFQKNNNL